MPILACSAEPRRDRRVRAYPNTRVVMRPSEKFEAKAAGQKCSPGVVFSTLRTFFTDNAAIGLCSRPQ
ncbi:MAG TPA: hypothetical protein VMW72_04805 [Sedimentisphaerales bacterium]|nr:hypothetical protein [Sedimentisphaerales bacterium]